MQTTDDNEDIVKPDSDDELEVEIKRVLSKGSLKMANIPISSPSKEKTVENVEDQQNASFNKVVNGEGNVSQAENTIPDMVMTASTAATPSAYLSIPCRTISQASFI